MAGKGFAYPVLFGDEKTNIRTALERRMRYIATFINSYLAAYDPTTGDLDIKDGQGVIAGTGFAPSDSLHLTTKDYVDTAVAGAGGGGGTILAGNTQVTSAVTVTTTETEYGSITVSGLGASTPIYVDVTVSVRVPSLPPNNWVSIRPTLNGSAQGSYAAIADSFKYTVDNTTSTGSITVDSGGVAHHHNVASIPEDTTDTVSSHTHTGSVTMDQHLHGLTSTSASYTTVTQRKVIQTTADGSGQVTLGAHCQVGSGSYGSSIVEVAYMVLTR